MTKVVAAEHNCCKTEERRIVRSCSESESTTTISGNLNSIGLCKSCCGNMGNTLPALANSVKLLSAAKYLKVGLINISQFLNLRNVETREYVACVNRAPPRLGGLGSSKTYLFKQVFLI